MGFVGSLFSVEGSSVGLVNMPSAQVFLRCRDVISLYVECCWSDKTTMVSILICCCFIVTFPVVVRNLMGNCCQANGHERVLRNRTCDSTPKRANERPGAISLRFVLDRDMFCCSGEVNLKYGTTKSFARNTGFLQA